MSDGFDLHQTMLEAAVPAFACRKYWTPNPEVPSGKIYGETAKADGGATCAAPIGQDFDMQWRPGTSRAGAEVSPFGPIRAICDPSATSAALIFAASGAAQALAATSLEARLPARAWGGNV